MEIIQGDDQVLIKETWPVLTEDKEDAYARLIHRADLLDTLDLSYSRRSASFKPPFN